MPVDPRELSREALVTLVFEQARVIERLEVAFAGRDALVEQLRGEVAELRRRLDQDSLNSSRPPSSDSLYGRPRPKASGMPAGGGPRRKRGKRPGAAGRSRRQVADPDETIPVEPQAWTGCGTGLGDVAVLRVFKRQVFEASPPPPPRVVQFNVAERQCPCGGQLSQGTVPAWASGRVQWGPGVCARVVLATIAHHPALRPGRPAARSAKP